MTTDLRLHGDTLDGRGALDFAVNVWPGERAAGLDAALREALRHGTYPDATAARLAVAKRHDRHPDEVLLLNGACEAFWLLAHALRPRRVACIHPGFTEPEAALRASGAEVTRVFRDPETWRLDGDGVPDDSEVVVVGSPDNPTGVLEPAGSLAALVRPGRLLVVDESFVDFVPGEPGSLANRAGLDGVLVVRSLTKLWSLAGIRAGYALGAVPLVRRLDERRQPWSVNALACAALAFCSADRETPRRVAAEVAAARDRLTAALSELAVVERVWPGAANFVLLLVADGPAVVDGLAARGISVRPASSFPGLGPNHIRVAVRPWDDCARLVDALQEID